MKSPVAIACLTLLVTACGIALQTSSLNESHPGTPVPGLSNQVLTFSGQAGSLAALVYAALPSDSKSMINFKCSEASNLYTCEAKYVTQYLGEGATPNMISMGTTVGDDSRLGMLYRSFENSSIVTNAVVAANPWNEGQWNLKAGDEAIFCQQHGTLPPCPETAANGHGNGGHGNHGGNGAQNCQDSTMTPRPKSYVCSYYGPEAANVVPVAN